MFKACVQVLLLIALLMVAACAAPAHVPEGPVQPMALTGSLVLPQEVGGAEEPPATEAKPAAATRPMDPTFKRRFLESYLAETDIEPGVGEDERGVLVRIMEKVSAEKLEEAATMVVKEMGPGSSAVFDFTLANIRFQQDRLEEAARSYRAAVDKFPKFRRAWGNLGQVHFRLTQYGKAVRPFSRVIELGGGSAVTYGLLGVCLTHGRQHLSAESAFRMAVMLAPDVIDWKMGLAESLFKQARYTAAAALFGGLIEKHPHRADLWLAQGEAYARQGKNKEAAMNFEMVDRLGGSTVASLINLGDIYANQELPDLAVSAYKRAMAKDTKGSPTRIIRAARFLCAAGALAEAATLAGAIEGAYGKQLNRKSRQGLLRLRARLALATGAGAEEAAVLKQLVDLDPMDGDALILLGQHAGRTGNTAQAIFYFERAANIEGFEADAKVRHAQLLVREGRYKAALPLLKRAQELKPRDNVQKYLEQIKRVVGPGR